MADSKKYREESERLRQEAAATSDSELQLMMFDIAALYERMADTLAKRAKPQN
jgi:hypothetical protein